MFTDEKTQWFVFLRVTVFQEIEMDDQVSTVVAWFLYPASMRIKSFWCLFWGFLFFFFSPFPSFIFLSDVNL